MIALKLIIASALVALGTTAFAQSYPSRPIRIVHGFPAGGPPDTVLRHITTRLEKTLGVPVLVENRPGASGMIGAAAVTRAEPDGYTLLFGVAANLAVAPAISQKPPYDPVAAFTPIIEVARGPYLWLVRSETPARSLPEFIAWARSQPGRLNYASPGEGSVHHLATEMLMEAAGIDMVHVPFTSSLYPALLSGQVDAMFESMPGPLPHLGTGKLRAIGVTGKRRLPALPEVPTFAEQGLQGLEVNSWWGLVGPAAMGRDIVDRLNREIAVILTEPELRATLSKMAIEASPGTPEAFGAYIAQEHARWKEGLSRRLRPKASNADPLPAAAAR